MALLKTPTLVTVDAGPKPVSEFSTVILCPGCTPTTTTVCWVTATPPPEKSADEVLMDDYASYLTPQTNQAILLIRGRQGPLLGRFVVRICIG